jgi:hypothetical protein
MTMALQAFMDTIKDKTTEPFCIETPHGRMLFAVIRRNKFLLDETIIGLMDKRLWGCIQCCETAIMFKDDSIGGIPLLPLMKGPLHDADETARLAMIEKICKESERYPIVDIYIFREKRKDPTEHYEPGQLEREKGFLGGFVDTKGGFPHINLPLPIEIPNETLVLYHALYYRYIKLGQLIRLIERAIIQGQASFDLMIASCDAVSNTDKYLPALKWVKTILEKLEESPVPLDKMDLLQQFMFFMPFLLETHFAPDASNGVISFHCHYLSECINKLLGKAEDIADLEAKMARNVDPTKLGIKTAPATERQLQSFRDMVGSFTVTAANPDDLPSGVRVSQSIEPGAAIARPSEQPGAAIAHPARGFASRVLNRDIIPSIRTIDALFRYCVTNPTVKLSVKKYRNVMLIGTTTMDEKYLSVPYFWGYPQIKNSSTKKDEPVPPEMYGMSQEWLKVTHIIPMWKDCKNHTIGRNAMFVIEGATYPTPIRLGSGLFLDSKYHAHERAFQEMLPIMTVNPGPTALGLGISARDQYNSIFPIQFRLDGIDITISYLF